MKYYFIPLVPGFIDKVIRVLAKIDNRVVSGKQLVLTGGRINHFKDRVQVFDIIVKDFPALIEL